MSTKHPIGVFDSGLGGAGEQAADEKAKFLVATMKQGQAFFRKK